MTTTDPRAQLARAIRDATEQAGVDQGELGALVAHLEGRERPYAQNAVSQWLAGRVDLPPGRVFAIERALGLHPGVLSVRAGFLPADGQATSLELALAADPDLTAVQREDVAALVEVLRQRTRARRG
ncbi:MAG TPA: hypothetical protein VGE43_19635 [Acidimicrobiales bacterium]